MLQHLTLEQLMSMLARAETMSTPTLKEKTTPTTTDEKVPTSTFVTNLSVPGCYNCGKPGHMADVCLQRGKTCYRCNQIGHIAMDCTEIGLKRSREDGERGRRGGNDVSGNFGSTRGRGFHRVRKI